MADSTDSKPGGAPDAGAGSGPADPKPSPPARPNEIGGRKGPDPTRYGDWEKNGRCVDF